MPFPIYTNIDKATETSLTPYLQAGDPISELASTGGLANQLLQADGSGGTSWVNRNVSNTPSLSSTGDWILQNGLGTAAIAGGQITLMIPAGISPVYYGLGYSDGPRARYIHNADMFNIDIYARLVSFTLPTAGTSNTIYYLNAVGEALLFSGLGICINSNGDVSALNMANDVIGAVQSGFPLDGTGWVRVSKKGAIATSYWGIGSSSLLPTTWTWLGSLDMGISTLSHVTVVAKHWSTGSATDSTFEWADVIIVDGTSYPVI